MVVHLCEIGHRLTDKFDDVPVAEMATRAPRVMLAGDACHTHSPRPGRAMMSPSVSRPSVQFHVAVTDVNCRTTGECFSMVFPERVAMAQLS